jgi:nickel-dependent lactate racemase
MALGKGLSEGYLSEEDIYDVIYTGLDSLVPDGKRLLFLIPDATRTMPMPIVFDMIEALLEHRASQVDFLVALGTHRPMNDAQMSRLVGKQVIQGSVGRTRIFNHAWDKPDTFTQVGIIPQVEIERLSGGMLSIEVPVKLNKLIYEYDRVIICGPVFPHEVVGFSGGNKYFFPGIAGSEIINITHWLGALITSYKVIGNIDTPVRSVIERAAEFISIPTASFSFVVDHGGVAGLFFGNPKDAWSAAAGLSAKRHIIFMDRPYKRVMSVMPRMYDDLWTAAKGMYKLEPVIANGGEVIIYAPHLYEVSYTYGKLLEEIGYHCRDYYLTQWERYKSYPWGVLAHSTHLKGLGIYDPESGKEESRISVTLATGITAEHCRKLNLGYIAPAEIHLDEWLNRENEGILVVQEAGETLYRLR